LKILLNGPQRNQSPALTLDVPPLLATVTLTSLAWSLWHDKQFCLAKGLCTDAHRISGRSSV
jgi:hypothetical protein